VCMCVCVCVFVCVCVDTAHQLGGAQHYFPISPLRHSHAANIVDEAVYRDDIDTLYFTCLQQFKSTKPN